MRYVVLLQDRPEAPADLRRRHMAEHLGYLAAQEGAVTAAGPLSLDGRPEGGLWLVEAPDRATVERMLQDDPLTRAGLRQGWRILDWTRVFPA